MKATLAAVLLLASAACQGERAQDKRQEQANAGEALALPALPGRAGAKLYTFDQQRSSIEFVGAKLTRKHTGKFASFRGSMQLVGGEVTSGAVSIVWIPLRC